MNLRFDKNSIRVRVSFDEAMILANDHHLQESFPLPGTSLTLSILCDSEDPLSLRTQEGGGLEMKVPRSGLESILSIANSGKVSVVDLELSSTNIHFEIDRFTVIRKANQ